jgi:uncharacterized tellurite resistance protein B-like protein
VTHVGPAPVATRPADAATAPGYIEWGPIVGGALLAAALSFVLLTFGTAIGLSATSPWPNVGLSGKVIASLAIFWVLAQQIGAFLAGGYIAGRMRTRWAETPQSEAEFRDGLHGGLVWALGIVIGAALFIATAGAVARTGAEVAGKAAVSAVSSTTNPMDALLDTLLRPAAQQPAAAGAPAAPGARAAASPEAARATIGRLLVRSVASGSVSNDDRSYLAQLVSQQTGLSQQEAEARVNAAFNAGREAADKARRAAILTGLVTAISLIVSFGAAWWAALKGGQHRDNAIPARFDFGTRRYGARPT